MAEVLNVEESIGEIEAEEAKSVEEPKTEVVDEDAGIPDHLKPRLKGKSRVEIAMLVAEQEKMISKQGQEVGEIRKLADELLKQQLHTKKPEVETVKEVDFFENPQEAIRQAVESNPKVMNAEQYMRQVQQDSARQQLAQKHPDFGQIVQDGDFAEWVKASKIRTSLYQQAENYDLDAADELLSTYKALKAVKVQHIEPPKEEVEARKKEVTSMGVDTGGAGESSKKVYRRADLIRLRLTNPAKFAAMQDEIDMAYQQGRVK